MTTNNEAKKEKLFEHFKNQHSFTTSDVYRFFSKTRPNIKKSTVNWRIYYLVQQGLLQRVGRGVYTLGKERQFAPSLPQNHQIVSSFLKKQFPLIAHSLWHTSALKEFAQHIPAVDFLLVEVERETVDSVFHILKELNKNTFKKPPQKMMEDFVLNFKNTVIIKPLISESPLQIINGISIPRLEKILVDLFADKEIFYFLHGNELLNIFKNAIEKYTINSDKLLRYAKRRNKNKEIRKILNQINGNCPFKKSALSVDAELKKD